MPKDIEKTQDVGVGVSSSCQMMMYRIVAVYVSNEVSLFIVSGNVMINRNSPQSTTLTSAKATPLYLC